MTHTPHTPSRRWLLWGSLALLALALLWAGSRVLQQRSAQKQALQAQQTAAPPALQAATSDWLLLAPRTLPLQVPVSGTLQAVDRAIVRARVSGELQQLTLREGDTVHKGQVIAKVDATDSEARYRQAVLQADAAQAQVAIQQRQYDNNLALVDQKFIAPTALATSQSNLQAAQANHAAARAAADAARKLLDDTVLRSPIEGQIARRWLQNGERVNAEGQVVEVVSLTALELQAPLPAQDSLHVQVGQSALLTVEGGVLPLTAQVVRISPSADSGSRAVPVYLRMPATLPGQSVQLRPGLFVQGHIATGQVQALAVPLDAVRNDQPQPYLQVVRQGVVVRQPIQLGAQAIPEGARSSAPWVAVTGVPEGAVVLLASMGALPEGTKVEVNTTSRLPAADKASAAATAPPTQVVPHAPASASTH